MLYSRNFNISLQSENSGPIHQAIYNAIAKDDIFTFEYFCEKSAFDMHDPFIRCWIFNIENGLETGHYLVVTPGIAAGLLGRKKILNYLLENKKFNINQECNDLTFIIAIIISKVLSSKDKNILIAQCLENGANPDHKNILKRPLHWAIREELPSIEKQLINAGANKRIPYILGFRESYIDLYK